MNEFDGELAERLASLRNQGLFRELRRLDTPESRQIEIQGQTLLNFSSNDYLGLANEPALKEAAIKAVERFGAGAGASRLISGSLAPHHELEEAIADFKGAAAALSFSTGYAAALGAIGALVGPGDVIILDKLVHACIVDAARLCGAKLRVFDHNDLADLERILRWTVRRSPKSEVRSPKPRVLVVTESVFSMDGDHAPLREMVALKERYGAWLMVDEAHATGLYGANRRGLAEGLGVSDGIEVQMGTLGKAMGAAGGYICGSQVLADYLVNRARTFIFSTAPVPAAAAAATAGIRFVQSKAGEERRTLLWQRVAEVSPALTPRPSPLLRPPEPPIADPLPTVPPLPFSRGEGRGEGSVFSLRSTAPIRGEKAVKTLHEQGMRNPRPCAIRSAIIPILIGDEAKAMQAGTALRAQGIFVPAIRCPTVARGQARLRVTVTAAHTQADLAQLHAALKSADFGF